MYFTFYFAITTKTREHTHRSGLMRGVVHGHGERGRQQVEEGPQPAEHELDLQPRDAVELLHEVEQVQPEQDAREPERHHRDPGEEGALAVVVEPRALDADEPEQRQQLEVTVSLWCK